MTRVLLFGANGMLGTYIYNYLKKSYDVVRITRKEYDVMNNNFDDLDNIIKSNIDDKTVNDKTVDDKTVDDKTVVVNALGTIPQASKNYSVNDRMYVKINSVFPNVLWQICKKYGVNMVHFTTDCVYDGLKGNYNENDDHTATSIYGISKSIGEPHSLGNHNEPHSLGNHNEPQCSVIRTSIIGEELTNKRSLLEWVISNKGGKMNGYINHKWNGITCLQAAIIVNEMIEFNIFWHGVRHIFSPNSVTKYELVKMINDIYELEAEVVEYVDGNLCDRTLASIHDPLFDIPSLDAQITIMKTYILN